MPRSARGEGWLVTAAVVALAVAFQGGGTARAQDAGGADAQPGETRTLVKGMHRQLRFDQDVARVAVGDAGVLSAEVLTSRSILLLGLETGRTSLLVWMKDDTLQAFTIAVQPDLDVLRRALADIHPAIQAEMAPDREAVILRGVVPDVDFARAAEAAAASYLRAGRGGQAPLVRARGAGDTAASTGADVVRTGEVDQRESSVINLIRVERLPQALEQRMASAIHATGASGVTVRRLMRGDAADDATDVFVLEGKVADQVLLTRVLHVARTMVLGDKGGASDLEVTADESGALLSGSGGGSRGGRRGGSSRSVSSSGSSTGGGSLGGGGNLDNEIESNLGRASIVSVGSGRVLSFVEVQDLPQVRVDVRLYEVNRTKLLEYAPEFTVLGSDFDQGGLLPASGATASQGVGAARVGSRGQEDVQGVLSFLADGLTGEGQVSGSHYAIDAALQILESRGLARSLANPSLTVLSGENAHFQVGGQIPVPQSFSPAFGGADTAGTTTPGVFSSVEFRSFGIELSVRPLVSDDGTVTLDLFSEVDRPAADLTTLIRDTTGTDQATTSFETRSLQTTTRLPDGHSLMMAGLISSSLGDSASYTPGIERIPVIGWLFKRFSIDESDRELVVIVNPTVVRQPVEGLGVWEFPDLREALRDYLDEIVHYNRGNPSETESR